MKFKLNCRVKNYCLVMISMNRFYYYHVALFFNQSNRTLQCKNSELNWGVHYLGQTYTSSCKPIPQNDFWSILFTLFSTPNTYSQSFFSEYWIRFKWIFFYFQIYAMGMSEEVALNAEHKFHKTSCWISFVGPLNILWWLPMFFFVFNVLCCYSSMLFVDIFFVLCCCTHECWHLSFVDILMITIKVGKSKKK